MKELSIEQKAKAYDEAIEKFGVILNLSTVKESGTIFADDIRKILPELNKSKDEQIRESLSAYFTKFKPNDMWNADFSFGDIVAWLEKQAEHANFRNKIQIGDKVTRNEDGALVNLSQLKRVAKSAGNVEPKFKVGDWIITNKNHIWYVDETPETTSYLYRLINQYGKVEVAEFEVVDEKARLWTIKDANDGDVLFCKGNVKNSNGIKYERVCLFNNLDKAFFTLTKLSSNSVEEYDVDVNIDYPDNTVPATKEQKEILFMAMKDSGYEWDDKKKKLKKVYNDIEIPFGAKDSELQEANYYIPKSFHVEIDDDKVVIKKGDKPTTWSEDDENYKDALIYLITEIKNQHLKRLEDLDRYIHWLKSLKYRVQPKQEWSEEDNYYINNCCLLIGAVDDTYDKVFKDSCIHYLQSLRDRCLSLNTWKPSEEQMQCIKDLIDFCEGCDGMTTLESLYNDLKKL